MCARSAERESSGYAPLPLHLEGGGENKVTHISHGMANDEERLFALLHGRVRRGTGRWTTQLGRGTGGAARLGRLGQHAGRQRAGGGHMLMGVEWRGGLHRLGGAAEDGGGAAATGETFTRSSYNYVTSYAATVC